MSKEETHTGKRRKERTPEANTKHSPLYSTHR